MSDLKRKVTFTSKKEVFEFGTVSVTNSESGSFKRFLDWPLISHHYDALTYSPDVSNEHRELSASIIDNLQAGRDLPEGKTLSVSVHLIV